MLKHLAAASLAALLFALPKAELAARPQEPPAPSTQTPSGKGAGTTQADPNNRRVEISAKPEPAGEAGCGQRGIVRLRAVLSHDGQVTNISVLQGLPGGLTEKAIEAARNIKFKPAQRDGRNVSQWVTLEYAFRIYHTDEEKVARKAVILERPAPAYTEEARRQKVAGKVVLDVWLCEDGVVGGVEVVEGLPHGLTEKAVEAARQIKFTPAEDEGKQVTVLRRVEYAFPPD